MIRSTFTKVRHLGTIVVHREEFEDGDRHIDDCYIVRLCARVEINANCTLELI